MGIFTTIVNIVSFYILTSAFEMDYKAATVAAWVLSVLFAYVTNKEYILTSLSSLSRTAAYVPIVSAHGKTWPPL